LQLTAGSIVNSPLDQLVVGLQPLSTPQDDRLIQAQFSGFRFLAGDGLEALEKNDENLSKTPGETGVFGWAPFRPQDFPMVDQLEWSDAPCSMIATTSPKRESDVETSCCH
jgi:hypothetical protein